MVTLDHSKTEVIIFAPAQFPIFLDASDLGPIKISWGRSRLAEPPANRVLSLTGVDREHLVHIAEYGMMPATIRLQVVGPGNQNHVLFTGCVDKVHSTDVTRPGPWTLRATENTSWWSAWQRQIVMQESFIGYRADEIEAELREEIQKPQSALSPGKPITPPRLIDPYPISYGQPEKTTIKQAYETIFAAAPLGFPSWSPDMKTLMSTTRAPGTTTASTVLSAQISTPPSLTLTAESLIGSVDWTFGGSWKTDKDHIYQTVPDVGIFSLRRGNQLSVSTPIGRHLIMGKPAFKNLLFTPLLDLLALQKTPPRPISIDSRRASNLPITFFLPWEHGQTLHIPDDPIGKIFETKTYLRPIGGTLTIHPTHLTHNMHCIWV